MEKVNTTFQFSKIYLKIKKYLNIRMTENFCESLKKIADYLNKSKERKIFDKEESPLLEETIMLIEYIIEKDYCLSIIPQAIQISKKENVFNKEELEDIKNILTNLKIFDNYFIDLFINC